MNPNVFLRINGYRIDATPSVIFRDMMQMFDSGTFDIAQLEPWLRKMVTSGEKDK